MLKKVLRQPADIWAVLLVVSALSVQLAVYFYVKNVWLMAGASVLLIPVFLSLTAYNHNHAHALTFVSPAMNRLFEIMIFFQTGSSPFSVTLNHIIGHHANYLTPHRDTLNWKRDDGSVMTRHEFAIKSLLAHYPSCFYLGKEKKSIFRKFLIYSSISLILLITLIVHNPVSALIVFVVPMLLQQYILKWGAYPHHSGLPQEDDYIASRTHTGKFYNWITWNAGYHAAHHFQQALHWSLLPDYHAKLAHKIPAELQGHGWGEQMVRTKMSAN